MGSAFGPYGMAAGAIIGGLVGFATSISNSAETIFESTVERLNKLKTKYEEANNKALESKSELNDLKKLK